MTAILQLAFLGGFRAVIEDTAFAPSRIEPISDFSSTKSQALLAYLACTRRRHTRDALATMLWGEFDDEAAKTSLRQSLANLKKLAGEHLRIERDAVEFDTHSSYTLDVEAFERDARGDVAARNRAVASYAGDLLKGLVVKNAPEFEEWLVVERERLRQLAADTLRWLARNEADAGDAGAAIAHLRALIPLDPLDESACRQLMLLLARNDQRTTALAQYETLARALQSELGVPPEAETTRLRERIRHATHAIQLPAEPAPLIGREGELQILSRRLADPNCRLITLVGLGGVGKTRLAVEAARDNAARFLHGVCFVPLAAAQDKAGLVAATLAALNVRSETDATDVAQLGKHLSDKEMLLVFDNAEHVIAACAEAIVAILKATPDVKCIVTSRERLNLRAEWVLALDGLPSGDKTSASVRLFQQAASRAGREVAGTPELARICQRLQGLPLALELAAPWARVMEIEQIEVELTRGLDLLSTTMRDVDERHRSLRAVFDHSWHMLSPDAARTLAALSVFRKGFTADAARNVAAATPAILSHLIDQSWLQQPEPARFDLHELVRQYAQGHLADDAREAALQRHSAYYAGWLVAREELRRSQRQREVAREIQTEIDNIRLMWETAVQTGNAEIFDKALACLFWISDILGRQHEAMRMYDAATECLRDRPNVKAVVGRLRLRHGVLARMIGHYQEAEQSLTEAERLLRNSGDTSNYAYVMCQLGVIRVLYGNIEAGVQQFEKSLLLYRELADLQGVADVLISMGIAEARLGHFDRAALLQGEAVDILTEIGDEMELAVAQNNLADTEYFRGRFDAALPQYRDAIHTLRQINDRRKLAISLNNASNLLCDMQRWDEALPMAQECVEIFREMGSRDGLMNGLNSAAGALLGMGNAAGALPYIREALTIAQQVGAEPEVINLLVVGGRLLYALGRPADAAQLLHSIISHPSATAFVVDAATTAMREFHLEPCNAAPWALQQMVDVMLTQAGAA